MRLIAITLCLSFVVGLAGCRCPSGCCVPGTPTMPCHEGWVEVDTAAPNLVEQVSAELELVPLPAPTETFQTLSPGNCQCMAATNAPVANMVELERHWAKVIIECDTKAVGENYCLDRDLLALHANEVRNESAAAALKAFYQLAGLEAKQHHLRKATAEASKTLERVNNLREKDLDIPEGLDFGDIEAQLHDLRDQQFQLEYARIQLNGQLQKLIDCPLNEYKFYWPEIDWMVNLDPLNIEAEVDYGLSSRADIRGLQLVMCKTKKITLPVTRAVLSYADGVLGSVEPRDGLIHVLRCFRCNGAEVPIRCRQLALFYTDKESKAIAEIKSAAYNISLQQQRVANTQATVDNLRSHEQELTEKRIVDNIPVFAISKARGDLCKAEIDLIDHVVALKVAQVELKRTQGVLAIECGFVPRLCCEGCCDGACCQCLKQRGCSASCNRCNAKKCCCE